ncbi:MAG: cobaltochelatase subunit CobT [Rhodospirillales bacterium RIFCSPLOWO2_12_FULL_58_28]|nr:MAG: cobaltochelatase subunit CobT [Rhodospirillales bacterium RIFCSPLOWO2_12_FULL_58_28]
MPQAEPPSELLKRVTAAALVGVAGAPRAPDRIFGGNAALLPEPPRRAIVKDDVTRLRGAADAVAVRFRHHDEDAHHRLMPSGVEARQVYEAAEQARLEALGGRRLSGVADNLGARLEEHCRDFSGIADREATPIADAVALLVREVLTGLPPPASAGAMMEAWRPWLAERMGKGLGRLADYIDDQDAFAGTMTEMISRLELSDADQAPDSDHGESEQDAGCDDEDHQPDAGAADQESVDGGLGGTDCDEAKAPPMPGEDMPADPGHARRPDNAASAQVVYRAYTTAFDQVINADKICDCRELTRLRAQLDQQLSHLSGMVRQLANRLQRRLLAKQTRSWNFGLDEGLLDSARLARVIVDPVHPLSFKQEAETDFRDTVVGLLIDNSGSMRGRPITVAAMCADILARTLERCGVKVEILGFTTQAWKGGHAREKWVADGKPDHPGRLNDLYHIIYKSADAPWRRTRRNLGLMLREGLLKENIDGEALLWAHSRLLARREQRRILMVISDGAPVDDATLSANAGVYLEAHLRQAISWIETRSEVELTAIGIGHDVKRYYRRAVTISGAEDLGGAMMQELTELFDEKSSPLL